MTTAVRSEVAVAPRDGMTRLQTELFSDARQGALARVLGASMDPQRFAQITYAAVVKNPDLLRCSAESIIVAVMEAAELGFAPTGALNRAFLVPFKNKDTGVTEAKLILGYGGLEDLARDSGYVKHIWTRVVYEGDDWEEHEGSDRRLVHVPRHATEDPLRIRYVYAMARFADGGTDWEVMSKAQVDVVRAKSKAPNSPAWVGSYAQMGRKTAVRRFVNNLPLTNRAQAAIALDDEREHGPAEPAMAVEAGPSTAARIRARVAARVPAGEAPGTVEEADVAPDTVPIAAEAEAEPAATTVPLASATEQTTCGATSPYDPPTPCVLASGHSGHHRSGERETW